MGKPVTIPIVLGMTVVDALTGFTGTVIGRAEYLYGCVRAEVQPKQLKEDGTLIEAIWFDIDRLIPMKSKPETVAAPEETTGGPERSTPPSRDP